MAEKHIEVVIDGLKYYIPEKEADREILIADVCKLKSLIDRAKSELDKLKERLVEHANRERTKNKSVVLQGIAGTVNVVFGETIEIKQDKAFLKELKKIYGEDHKKMVVREIRYKPTKDLREKILKADAPEELKTGLLIKSKITYTIKPK